MPTDTHSELTRLIAHLIEVSVRIESDAPDIALRLSDWAVKLRTEQRELSKRYLPPSRGGEENGKSLR